MKRKCFLILIAIFMVSITAVSAQNNMTEIQSTVDSGDNAIYISNDDVKLEKTYFYDADTDRIYKDDSVVTHNVVKYYGDDSKRFKVVVFDDDYNPLKNVEVSFEINFKYKQKTTNENGVVYFSLKNKPGTYDVETSIRSDNGYSYWFAYNTVKIKSTVPVKELVKYKGSSKKFQVKFLNTKGHVLNDTVVKIKIRGKWHKFKTNSKGIIKIKSNFKRGKDKIVAYNPVSGEKRSIPVYILKKGVHKMSIRIDDPTGFFPTKRLKNGDNIFTVYETEYKQYSPGVFVQCSSDGLNSAKHTKVLKVKFYFKNKKTGKVITKTSKKVRYNGVSIKPIKSFSPYKAKVWYREVKKL